MDFFHSKIERKHDPVTQTENNFSTDLWVLKTAHLPWPLQFQDIT